MRDACFQCAESDCFGNQNGWCRVLTSATVEQPCPFKKTQEQLIAENKKNRRRWK